MTKHAALILMALAMACSDDGGSAATDPDPTTDPTSATDPDPTTDPSTDSATTDPSTDSATTDPSTDSATTDPSTDSMTTDTATTTEDSSGTIGDTDGTTTDDTDSSSSDDGVTTGEPAELEAALVDVSMYMNCKPLVPPDPLIGGGGLELDNPGADIASVTVSSVRLLDNGVEAAEFTITPSDLGAIAGGDNEQYDWDKTMGSLMPANGCDTLTCGGEYTLEIILDADGEYAIATEDIVVECAL